ncbi:DUF5696 domain-containing protein [Paenibacillus mendelii]|uniref:DUF5696 domain-containing protein n=1 Tax=Paenibacillus mendelii TaxID=206163 RepID=A0ABV6JDG6_9BACL|nr:DUF5696 domain-containing protein [Paenibacillus mendelii]MCQ6563538.1 DUF5696 domain-containing protein [Paenibacillus mendelii]
MKKEWLPVAFVLVLVAAFLLVTRPYLPPDKTGLAAGGKKAAAAASPTRSENGERPYQLAAENERLRLEVNEIGQFMVTDLRNGHQWRSNPAASAMEQESVQGLWRQHLLSPFIIETVERGKAKPEQSNWLASGTETSVQAIPGGVRVKHDLAREGIRLTYSLLLHEEYVAFSMDENAIEEYGSRALVMLRMFPFLGAMQDGSSRGGLFVPEGMGAVIPIDGKPKLPYAYSGRVYGSDISVVSEKEKPAVSNSPMPVFGVIGGNNSYLGVVEKGDFLTQITAYPSGLITSFNWVAADFILRETYFTKTSSFGQGFYQYEEKLRREPIEMRYYFQQGEEAGYVGMAQDYRAYLIEEQGAQRIPPVKQMPLDLVLYGGAEKEGFFGDTTVTATSFQAAKQIVSELGDAGISALRVTYEGWSEGGEGGPLPTKKASDALGGSGGLRHLAEHLQETGGELYVNALWHAIRSSRGFLASRDGLRDLSGNTIVSGLEGAKTYYYPPRRVEEIGQEMASYLQELGVSGVAFDGIGASLFTGYEGDTLVTRQAAAQSYLAALDGIRAKLGGASAAFGNAYTIGHVDHIREFPLGASYDLIATKSVPFYPIAVHGLATYTAIPQNLQNEAERGFLQSIEFGAMPTFTLTHEDPIILKDTLGVALFSSRFSEWKSSLLANYTKTAEWTAATAHRFIVGHSRIGEDVYRTDYEGGLSVIVNYGSKVYAAEGLRVPAGDFVTIGKAVGENG